MLTSCNIEFDKNSINSEFKINCSTEFVSNDSLGQNKNISLHINNINHDELLLSTINMVNFSIEYHKDDNGLYVIEISTDIDSNLLTSNEYSIRKVDIYDNSYNNTFTGYNRVVINNDLNSEFYYSCKIEK